MLGHRQLTIEEYLEILRRRLWFLLIPAVLGAVGSYMYSLTVPDRYTSQTLVLVEQQKVPDAFVKSVVNDELNQRLGTMREQILSRSRLEPLIERYNLFADGENKRRPTEDLLDQLRSAILVTPVQPVAGTSRQGLSGFHVSFTWSDPRLAQQICQQITSMFMEENIKFRSSRAEQTTKFLDTQLAEAKHKLDEQDARLAEFKRRYIGQLPGNEQLNLNVLMGLNTQLDTVTQQLNRALQDSSHNDSQLAQQLSLWQSSQGGSNPRALEQQLEKQQGELLSLEARYTPDHPDVVKLRADIAQLKRKIEEIEASPQAPKAGASDRSTLAEPTHIQQLRNQVRLQQQTIREKTKEQERLQEQIRVYQARVQLSPVVEQQYKDLTRDHETALEHYNDLLAKLTQSQMATKMEIDQQGEQFRVMDAPNLPEKPTYPDRSMFAMGGLGMGLLLGVGLTLLLEMRDKSIRSERDVEALLGLPVLAMVPAAGNGAVQGRFWKRSKPQRENIPLEERA